LHGWCYWTLRKAGRSVAEATGTLAGRDVASKNELLFRAGVNFNEVPAWQRRGTGLYQVELRREGFDPKRGCAVSVSRRRVKVDRELPLGEEYAAFIRRLLVGAVADTSTAGGGESGDQRQP
jgi:tRNA(His) 5'-end guanylyltransferase